MLLSMMLVSMVAVVTLGSIVFLFSKRTIEQNYQTSHEYNLQVSSSIIDIYFNGFVDLSRTLLNNYAFKQVLLQEKGEPAYFSSVNSRQLERTLNELGEQSKYLQNCTIISTGGHIHFQSKLNHQSGKMQKYYRGEDILSAGWLEHVKKAEGREVFFGYNVLFDDDGQTLSMVKELRNPEDYQVMGYGVFNIKKTVFQPAFGKNTKEYVTNRFMIIDQKAETKNPQAMGELLYFNGSDRDKEAILKAYLNRDSARYLFSECANRGSGFAIVNVIEKEELSKQSSYIGWVTVLVCIGIWIVCIGVSNVISKAITKPLVLLGKMIKRVGDGKFRVDAQFDESEIGQIGNQFKHMVNNNLDLHEKLLRSDIREKEAELLLLQSQINPHFLYNTLDSLYFMAIIKEEDEIAEMVLALSDTFKLSLNRGDKLIEVEKEIEKIQAYMKIQNLRYHDRFTLDIQVDDDILPEKMLSFLLQPLVENAVYHGLEPKVGNECSIVLQGCRRDGKLLFVIQDNGVGIEDMSQLEQGYGVKNIIERIRLFYGDAGKVEFDSALGRGTRVVVKLPLIRPEGGDGG